jgi:hypothetical protein
LIILEAPAGCHRGACPRDPAIRALRSPPVADTGDKPRYDNVEAGNEATEPVMRPVGVPLASRGADRFPSPMPNFGHGESWGEGQQQRRVSTSTFRVLLGQKTHMKSCA